MKPDVAPSTSISFKSYTYTILCSIIYTGLPHHARHIYRYMCIPIYYLYLYCWHFLFYLFIIIFFYYRVATDDSIYNIIYDAYNIMSNNSSSNSSEFVLYIILDHVRGHERLTFTRAHTLTHAYSDDGCARVMEKYINIRSGSHTVYTMCNVYYNNNNIICVYETCYYADFGIWVYAVYI